MKVISMHVHFPIVITIFSQIRTSLIKELGLKGKSMLTINNNQIATLYKNMYSRWIVIVRNIFKGERFMFASHINEFLIDRNEAKNSEAFLVEIPPRSKTHLHSHEKFEQTFFVVDGEGVIITEGRDDELSICKNDIVFITFKPASLYS